MHAHACMSMLTCARVHMCTPCLHSMRCVYVYACFCIPACLCHLCTCSCLYVHTMCVFMCAHSHMCVLTCTCAYLCACIVSMCSSHLYYRIDLSRSPKGCMALGSRTHWHPLKPSPSSGGLYSEEVSILFSCVLDQR